MAGDTAGSSCEGGKFVNSYCWMGGIPLEAEYTGISYTSEKTEDSFLMENLWKGITFDL